MKRHVLIIVILLLAISSLYTLLHFKEKSEQLEEGAQYSISEARREELSSAAKNLFLGLDQAANSGVIDSDFINLISGEIAVEFSPKIKGLWHISFVTEDLTQPWKDITTMRSSITNDESIDYLSLELGENSAPTVESVSGEVTPPLILREYSDKNNRDETMVIYATIPSNFNIEWSNEQPERYSTKQDLIDMDQESINYINNHLRDLIPVIEE